MTNTVLKQFEDLKLGLPTREALTEIARVSLSIKESTPEDSVKKIKKISEDSSRNKSWGISTFSPLDDKKLESLISFLQDKSNEDLLLIINSLTQKDRRFIGSINDDLAEKIENEINTNLKTVVFCPEAITSHLNILSKIKDMTLIIEDSNIAPLAKLILGRDVKIYSRHEVNLYELNAKQYLSFGPFGRKVSDIERNYIEDFGLRGRPLSQELDLAIAIKNNPNARIISTIPAGMTFSNQSRAIRNIISNQTNISKITELSKGSFRATMIQTYLLVLNSSSENNTLLRVIDKGELLIDQNRLREADIWNLDRFFESGYRIEGERVDLKSITNDSFRGPLAKKDEKGEPYYFIQNKDLKNTNSIDLDNIEETNLTSSRPFDRYFLKDGDILITCRGHAFDTATLTNVGDKKVVCSQNIAVIRLNDQAETNFILEYLNSPLGQSELEARQVGSTMLVLSIKDLNTINVPLIPIEKQRAIVNKYEKAINEINSKINELEALKNYQREELFKQMNILEI